MKRMIGSVLFGLAASSVFAQAPFTIVRPVDGSKVKEVVRILFPKNSIPGTGYIGIYINGKLLEATVPQKVEGNYLVYELDTKARKIKDGVLNLKAVLFAEGASKPTVVDTSSVNLNVTNTSSISIPAGGVSLRYRFTPGSQYIYSLENRVVQTSITEAQAKAGGRPATLPVDSEKFNLLYAVDNAYGNGDGLIRIQAIPKAGKDYITYTDPEDGEIKKFYDYMMQSLYMRISSTGREIFSSVPTYFPLEGSPGEGWREDLIALWPLPTFPAKAVKPGSSWEGGFQLGNLEMEKRDEVKSMVTRIPARGEFVGVEWEMGRPCAKIRNSFEIGMGTGKAAEIFQRMAGISGAKLEETIWFALDKRIPIKIVRETIIDRKEENPGAGAGAGLPGDEGDGPAAGAGRPGPAGRGKGGPGASAGDMSMTQGGGPQIGKTDDGSGRSRGGQNFGQGRGQRGGGAGNAVLLRTRVQQIFILQQ